MPCLVFESATDLRPLGVCINLQPNAVRALYELGFGSAVPNTIGIQTREWTLVSLNGHDVYCEPRGRGPAGRLPLPQYSVHRGTNSIPNINR